MIVINDLQSVYSEASSKGNQLKFYNQGYWIKLDNRNCFEGLAENFVSEFEKCILDFNFVPYFTDIFSYNGDEYRGCYSPNMYGDASVSFISLRSLFRANSVPLNIFIKESSIEQNIINVVNVVYSLTGINIFTYLAQLILLDALILNEDRHYMNLGLVHKGKSYVVAPCFDNGSSLFCTNWTYRKTKTLDDNLVSASNVARPFSKFYDKQVQAFINLGAKPLVIKKQMLDNLIRIYDNKVYLRDVVDRVKLVLLRRLDYYNGKGVFVYV